MSPYVDQIFQENRTEIQEWLLEKKEQVKNFRWPIYSSFDLRNNGYKAAIIDSNLFPSGFNNIDITAQNRAIQAFSSYLPQLFHGKKILIIPEKHTRNLYYLHNLKVIQSLLIRAGYETIIGCLHIDLTNDQIELKDDKGDNLVLERIFRNGQKLNTISFLDGLILLNNDFSIPNPPLLNNLEQVILPPLQLSWTYRKKSSHFSLINRLLEEFSKATGIDPWHFIAIYKSVDNINFKDKTTLEPVVEAIDTVLELIEAKYAEYDIKDRPYVFVKDNSGTYGMGILTVETGDEILNLNSAKRRKMAFGKQGSKISSVIVQEGIRTIHISNGGSPAEPVIYSVGRKIIGGFTRFHPERNDQENLNTPGMKFKKLISCDATLPIITGSNELSLYSFLTDLALIAVAYEYKEATAS